MDNLDFHYNIVINIIYIKKKPVLYLFDETIQFQAGSWLKNVSAQIIRD